MRLFLSITVFLISFSSISQDLSKDLYGFKKSYILKSLSKVEILSLVKEWIGQNFESPSDAIKYVDENKIIVERGFKMSPKIIQTAQNTTSNYKVSSELIFFISENKLTLEMHLNDIYSFDGKKGDPNTNWEIINGQVDETFIRDLLTRGYTNVKQFSSWLAIEKKGDAMAKKAIKYVNKEIKKGVFIKRIIKVSNELNNEVKEVFNSIEQKIRV
ncbi:MAG: hypothetical protein CMC93_03865 [Flavobacteriaceae bacterium]|nr:hypothetical protein [Flavobacteriaceae bacterium]